MLALCCWCCRFWVHCKPLRGASFLMHTPCIACNQQRQYMPNTSVHFPPLSFDAWSCSGAQAPSPLLCTPTFTPSLIPRRPSRRRSSCVPGWPPPRPTSTAPRRPLPTWTLRPRRHHRRWGGGAEGQERLASGCAAALCASALPCWGACRPLRQPLSYAPSPCSPVRFLPQVTEPEPFQLISAERHESYAHAWALKQQQCEKLSDEHRVFK